MLLLKNNYDVAFIIWCCLTLSFVSCKKDDPQAEFDASIKVAFPGEEIFFENLSENSDSYFWDFGDGTKSEEYAPNHSYLNTGTFNISLVASSDGSSSTMTKKGFITVIAEAEAKASFFTQNVLVYKGTQVYFENTSQNATQFKWTFGDGNSTSVSDPVHVYSSLGSYSVTLMASNSTSESIEIKTDYITVISSQTPPTANFSVSDTIADIGESIDFENTSTYAEEYLWDFGDGNISYAQNPIHSYDERGIYSIKLTVFNEIGQDSITRNDVIAVMGCLYEEENTEINELINPNTGRIWMDRNLGALRVAQSPYDEAAYGDLYQWGRSTDGHQCRNSPVTSVLSNTSSPNNELFILSVSDPHDWMTFQNEDLWQGESGLNNPCPENFEVPTAVELVNEFETLGIDSWIGAFDILKFPRSGRRWPIDGEVGNPNAFFWTSTRTSEGSGYIFISGGYSLNFYGAAMGASVRCIKN